MAQDKESIQSVFAWASSNAITSAFAEGTIFLGYPFLATLAGRPEYRVITETMASEMTREWIEFKSKSGEDKTEKIKELQEFMVEFNCQEIARKAAEGDGFFGRGHIFVDTGDGKDEDELKTSIGDGRSDTSKSKVTKDKLVGFRNVEAMWCYPTDYNANNPLDPTWYKPQIWIVMGKSIHATRLLTLVSREVPDILKVPAFDFGRL